MNEADRKAFEEWHADAYGWTSRVESDGLYPAQMNSRLKVWLAARDHYHKQVKELVSVVLFRGHEEDCPGRYPQSECECLYGIAAKLKAQP